MPDDQGHVRASVVLFRACVHACRDSNPNRGSLSKSGEDLHMPADHVRSLLHAHESETTTVLTYGLQVESTTVVGDGQLDVLAGSGERDREPSRVAMHGPVAERLLRDSKQTHCDTGLKAFELAFGREAHL